MNTNADVIRLENTWAGLTGIVRGGQIGVTTDYPTKILMKRASGSWNQWTSDEDRDLGATGVSYTNGDWPTVQNVQDALDIGLQSVGGYIVNSGVTGIPVWGDGMLENSTIAFPGTAVYSEDGNVYYMSEAGFTGVSSISGCKFVVSPVRMGEDIKFVAHDVNVNNYSYIGYTGANENNSEMYMVSTTGSGTSHLRLEASYGKIKLTTGSSSAGQNGIVLSGEDDDGTQYNVAAAGKHRALYVDEDGEVVVAASDTSHRYQTGGFTAIIGADHVDTVTYAYWTYKIDGNIAHITTTLTYGNSNNSTLEIYGMPALLNPSTTQHIPCIVRDEANCGGDSLRPARATFTPGDTGISFYPLYVDGDTISYDNVFAVSGIKGIDPQVLTFSIS